MKTIKLLTALLFGQFFSVQFLFATDIPENPKSHFYSAKQELVNMLEGKKPLSFEQAITTIENAYLGNQVDISFFNYSIGLHLKNIQRLIDANRNYSNQDFKRTLLETQEQKKTKYERSLANWAIFSYMTDTTFFVGQDKLFYNLPFNYSTNDPLGTINWSNTQVFNLLDTKKGNCFALVSLFKIFSERLNSQAIICTAPGHIYIRHADHKGIFHNVELATRSFPGTGSMETLTYTTDEATKNGISLRELDLKQSVALCLVYLAKGYEYKFNTRNDDFILECAELALKFDSLNLNAMLLKSEFLEERLIAKNKTVAQLQKEKDFVEYENYINHLFSLGYREMPMEMKNLVISRLRNEDSPFPIKDHTPKPNEHLGVKNDRYFTLSGGLFDEMMLTKPIEQYHRTHFDTKKKKISAFVPLDNTYNKYPIDLVVFAWQIDPLAPKYPSMSPYAAFSNNPIYFIDSDGRDAVGYIGKDGKLYIQANYYAVTEGKSTYSDVERKSLESKLNGFWAQAKGMSVTLSDGRQVEIGGVDISVKPGGDFNSVVNTVNSEDGANALFKASSKFIKSRSGQNPEAITTNDIGGTTLNTTFLDQDKVGKFAVGDEQKKIDNAVIDESGHILGTRHPKRMEGESNKDYNKRRESTYGDLERGNTSVSGTLKVSQKDLQNIVNSKEFKIQENKQDEK